MRHALLLTLSAALLAAPSLAGEAAATPPDRTSAGESELARMLDGRIAGEPVRCLNRSHRASLTVVDRTALVFRHGNTLYVNRPKSARALSDWDIPVFRRFGSSLCALDQVEMRDRSGIMAGPIVLLGEFIPYTKPAKES